MLVHKPPKILGPRNLSRIDLEDPPISLQVIPVQGSNVIRSAPDAIGTGTTVALAPAQALAQVLVLALVLALALVLVPLAFGILAAT